MTDDEPLTDGLIDEVRDALLVAIGAGVLELLAWADEVAWPDERATDAAQRREAARQTLRMVLEGGPE